MKKSNLEKPDQSTAEFPESSISGKITAASIGSGKVAFESADNLVFCPLWELVKNDIWHYDIYYWGVFQIEILK